MSNKESQTKDVLEKIENYNQTINELHSLFNEDINEILNTLLLRNSIGSYDSISINDKILNRIIYLIGTSYYGWFEFPSSTNIDTNKQVEIKPNKLFSYEELNRIMQNDYMESYRACYKTGNLNILRYTNLVIKILKDKINRIHDYLNRLDELYIGTNIIKDNTQVDLNIFTIILQKVVSFRNVFVLDLIMKLDINEDKKDIIVMLLSKVNDLKLNETDRSILRCEISEEKIESIEEDMDLYIMVKNIDKIKCKVYI